MADIKDTGVSILYVEEPVNPVTWANKPHTHACYHMFFVEQGTLSVRLGDTVHTLRVGQTLLVPPQTLHGMAGIWEEARPTVREVLFDIDDPALGSRVQSLGPLLQMDGIARALFFHVQTIGNTRVAHMKRAANRFLEAMLEHICLCAEPVNAKTLNKQLIDTAGFSPITASVVAYVDAHYAERITLKNIAAALGYSGGYLCKVFKKDCSFTINEYTNLVRISRIVRHLSFVDASVDISLVCHTCGFRNTSHFNRMFKQFLGVSPSVFKHMQPIYVNGAPAFSADMEFAGKIQTILQYSGALTNRTRP